VTSSQRVGAGHRAVPHTSDVILEAWGPSRAACLRELVAGLVDAFADTRHVTVAPVERRLTLRFDHDEDLAIALLEEVVYLLDAEGLVVVDVALVQRTGGLVDATFAVVPVGSVVEVGAPPKGVSRSELSVTANGPSWRARALVDV
jgi:SHS2 domain-containing protein